MINNADSFSQSSLIIFTKGADIFGHDFISTKGGASQFASSSFNLYHKTSDCDNY